MGASRRYWQCCGWLLALVLAASCTGGAPAAPGPLEPTPALAASPSPPLVPTPAPAPSPTPTLAAPPSPPPAPVPPPTPSPDAAPQPAVTVGSCRFTVELARTQEERSVGLMDRRALPQDHGMLFIYPLEDELRFWMRNTLVPLDVLFLGSTLRVVDVQRMTPEPGVPPQDLTIYASQAPARYALEVNAGRAEACGVAPGAEAVLEGFSPEGP